MATPFLRVALIAFLAAWPLLAVVAHGGGAASRQQRHNLRKDVDILRHAATRHAFLQQVDLRLVRRDENSSDGGTGSGDYEGDEAKQEKEADSEDREVEDDDAEADELDKEEEAEEENIEKRDEERREKARQPEKELLRHTLEAAKSDFDKNLKQQAHLQAKINELTNDNMSSEEIDAIVKPIGNETQSPALQQAIGTMWKEMRVFALPDFIGRLREELAALKKDEQLLEDHLRAAQGNQTAAEARWTRADQAAAADDLAEDEDVEDAVEQPKTARAEPVEGTHEPMYTAESMPKVSSTVKCVLALCMLYFMAYLMLAITRTGCQLTDHLSTEYSASIETAATYSALAKWQDIIYSICATVTYAPMLCVLFLATRMRAIHLTQGETDKYGLPQPWAQSAMYVATVALTFQVLVVLLIQYFKFDGRHLKSLEVANYVVRTCLYAAFTTVSVAAVIMKPPHDLWKGRQPSTTPVLACTITLTVAVFALYLARAVCQTVNRLTGKLKSMEILCDTAMYYANLTPMACILFIAANMRAVQLNIDLPAGVRAPMLVCTVTLPMVLLVTFLPLLDRHVKVDEREELVVPQSMSIVIAINLIRYLALIAFYLGCIMMLLCILFLGSPDGREVTPPFPPAVQCVMVLTTAYFFTYAFLFVAHTLRDFSSKGLCGEGLHRYVSVDNAAVVAEAGQRAVRFAPMLCMLFIAARMRATQITMTVDGRIPASAGPQAWAQEAMFLSTYAVVAQLILTYLATLFLGTGMTLDKPTLREQTGSSNRIVSILMAVVKYTIIAVMFGGALVVMASIFTMTPETLPPYVEHYGVLPGVKVTPPPTLQ